MACNLTQGRQEVCKESIGGLQGVYFLNFTTGSFTTTTNATNQAVYDVTKTILDTIGQIITNSIDLNPVIRIPQGTKVTVIVNSDIKIPPVNSR